MVTLVTSNSAKYAAFAPDLERLRLKPEPPPQLAQHQPPPGAVETHALDQHPLPALHAPEHAWQVPPDA